MGKLKEALDAHAENIVKKMGAEFDSHDFIEQFLTDYEKEYVELLSDNINSDNGIFRTVHAQIGRYLSDNVPTLEIEKTGKVQSTNIKGNKSKNQGWKKKNIG
jgi:hypothetical protein